MDPKDIAKAIVNRPNNATQLMTHAYAQQAMGQEGFHEAIQRSWIVPDFETGMVSVSCAASTLEEIRHLAEDAGRTFRNGTMTVVGVQNGADGKPLQIITKPTAMMNNPSAPQTTMMITALSPQDRTELGYA